MRTLWGLEGAAFCAISESSDTGEITWEDFPFKPGHGQALVWYRWD